MSDKSSCHAHGCNCHAAPPPPKPFTVGPGFVAACFGVMALIALIVYVFVPVRWILGRDTELARGLRDARFIYMTLNIYASDNMGAFPQLPHGTPEGEGNANLVYKQLVPHYLTGQKECFHRDGSAWTPEPAGSLKSGKDELLAGENHYAYIAGLSRKSPEEFPLVVDGSRADRPGVYSTTPGERGYTGPEGSVVVVRVDGSGSLRKVNAEGRLLRGGNADAPDYFSPGEGWLGQENRFLNPAK